MPDLVGETRGNNNHQYRFISKIEDRGYGAIYRARQVGTDLDCLIKSTWDISNEAHYATEIGLYHQQANPLPPNLPAIIDHFFINSSHQEGYGQFLVFEWTGAQTLAHLLEEKGVLSIQEAVAHATAVCNALDFLHNPPLGSTPVIHKHISPTNIVVHQGQTKLRDFGLTHIQNDLHKESRDKLSNRFAAPEQFSLIGSDTTIYSDIYSVGAMLYFLVTGQAPLSANDRKFGNNLPRANEIRPDVPQSLADVIAQAMSLDPHHRYNSVIELRQALSAFTQSNSGNSDNTWGALLVIAVIIGIFWLFGQGNNTNTPPPARQDSVPMNINQVAIPTLEPVNVTGVVYQKSSGVMPLRPFKEQNPLVLQDFGMLVDVTIPSVTPWDIGFIFRNSSAGYYELVIASDGLWYLEYVQHAADGNSSRNREMQGAFNTSVVPGNPNRIELIVTGDTATLSINQITVANSQLAMPATPGEFRLMNGLHPTQKSVNPMPFENFMIWQPQYSD